MPSTLPHQIARGVSLVAIWTEFTDLLFEARWLFVVLLLCVIVDFRFGLGESRKRYAEAKQRGDLSAMELYRWHKSRAIRRTANKLFDYILWTCLGIAIGQGLLVPIGVERIFGGVGVVAIFVFCEISSILGHFFYLHATEGAARSVRSLLRAFAVAYLKKKNEDAGQALEDALEGEENIDNNSITK